MLIWLDYAQANGTRQQLDEVRNLASRLRPYDVLKVTFNANPSLRAGRSLLAERLVDVRQRLGDLLPEGVSEGDMKQEEFPKLLLKMLERAIKNGMNGAPSLMMQPLANFAYSDSFHQMLTFTGIVLGRDNDGAFLREARIKAPEFVKSWTDYQRIDVPFLSLREKLLIDSALFNKGKSNEPPKRLRSKLTLAKSSDETRRLIKTYAQFYRFYPHFHRVYY